MNSRMNSGMIREQLTKDDLAPGELKELVRQTVKEVLKEFAVAAFNKLLPIGILIILLALAWLIR